MATAKQQSEVLRSILEPELLDAMAEAVERGERDLDVGADGPVVIPLFLAGLAATVRAIGLHDEPQASEEPVGRHPLEGLYCLEESRDPEVARFGWMFERQARVRAIVDGVGLVELYSVLDGAPTSIEPIPVAVLLSGRWRFYSTRESWNEAASAASERYFRRARADARGEGALRGPRLVAEPVPGDDTRLHMRGLKDLFASEPTKPEPEGMVVTSLEQTPEDAPA